ncbi:hypothetical protein ACFX2G_034839 [Malus domestica]
MFSEFEIEANPEAKTRTSCQANLRVVESSVSKPDRRSKVIQDILTPKATITRKRTRFQTFQTFPSILAIPTEAGKKK